MVVDAALVSAAFTVNLQCSIGVVGRNCDVMADYADVLVGQEVVLSADFHAPLYQDAVRRCLSVLLV